MLADLPRDLFSVKNKLLDRWVSAYKIVFAGLLYTRPDQTRDSPEETWGPEPSPRQDCFYYFLRALGILEGENLIFVTS